VGLPALVMTPAVHLVAYTDGTTGEIWAQPLTSEGRAVGEPVLVGSSKQQLYTDAVFADGALALTAVGSRAVLAYVDSSRRLRLATSDDGGRTWLERPINQPVDRGRPQLATDGSTVLLAVIAPGIGNRRRTPILRIWRSTSAGSVWQGGPSITDNPSLGQPDLVWGEGRWRVTYIACPGAFSCATPARLWYATSVDGMAWSEPSVVSEPTRAHPVGIVAGSAGVSVVWAIEPASHDWRFVVSRRTDT
jgi:hypothetical protein